MRRIKPIAALSISALIALSACSGGGDDPTTPAETDGVDYASMSHEELVEAAEAEGEVVVYSFTSRIAQVEEAFEAEYDIDVVAHDISATEQVTRLTAEHEAQGATADVAYISDAPVVLTELVESGILHPYVPPRVADVLPEEHQAPLAANRISTKILMYNEEAYPDGSPITNLWQLTDEEWNGKVIMVDPTIRGDYLDLMTEIILESDAMAAAYQEHTGSEISLDDGVNNAGEQFIKDLYANGLLLVDDTDAVNAAVGATGQEAPPVGFTSYSDRRDNEDEGWALQAAIGTTPSVGITFPAYLGVVDNAEHPAAARLLIDFLMGDDSETGGPGYEPFYVPGDYAARTDITPHPDAVSLEELGAWAIDPAASAEIRRDVSDFLLTLS